MGFIKAIMKFFGGLLVFISLALIFASNFDVNLVNSFDAHKDDINGAIVNSTYDMIEEQTGLTEKQIEKTCQNGNDEFCESFEKNIQKNSPIEEIENKLKETLYWANSGQNIGVLLLIIGAVLFIVGMGWRRGIFDLFVSVIIACVFNFIFYRFALIGLVNSLVKSLISGIGKSFLDDIYSVVNVVINSAIVETITFIIIVGVISIVVGIIFFMIRKK
jgi:hypothetical protein